MNNQMPFGFNPNMQPMFPGANENEQINIKLQTLEKRINILENKIQNIESNFNISSDNSKNPYNPYQTSIHMM